MALTGLQERLYDTTTGSIIPASYEAREPISTPIPSYVTRAFQNEYNNRRKRTDLLSEGSGVLYQQQRVGLKDVKEYIQKHPLATGTGLGAFFGALTGVYNIVSPYVTVASTLANIGIVALGATVGGLFGLGLGAFLYGLFRGKRKYAGGQQNPQYKGEPRGLINWFLDWTFERKVEELQGLVKAIKAMPQER